MYNASRSTYKLAQLLSCGVAILKPTTLDVLIQHKIRNESITKFNVLSMHVSLVTCSSARTL